VGSIVFMYDRESGGQPVPERDRSWVHFLCCALAQQKHVGSTVGAIPPRGNTMSQGEITHTRGVVSNSSCGEFELAVIFGAARSASAGACQSSAKVLASQRDLFGKHPRRPGGTTLGVVVVWDSGCRLQQPFILCVR
jgi:hypothetical protein